MRVDWYRIVFELIDMRSFSNLWFWIILAVQWSMTSHFVLGVPYDLLQRARRGHEQAQEDLEALARIKVNRLLYITHVSGMWIVGFVAFVLSVLLILGFVYNIEFAQAVFCLVFPMAIVGLLTLGDAHRIADGEYQGQALQRRLTFLRVKTQAVGVLAILFTSMWGMYQNLQIGALG